MKAAFPSLQDLRNALRHISPVCDELHSTLDGWAQLGCNEVIIYFEAKSWHATIKNFLKIS